MIHHLCMLLSHTTAVAASTPIQARRHTPMHTLTLPNCCGHPAQLLLVLLILCVLLLSLRDSHHTTSSACSTGHTLEGSLQWWSGWLSREQWQSTHNYSKCQHTGSPSTHTCTLACPPGGWTHSGCAPLPAACPPSVAPLCTEGRPNTVK